MKSHAQLCFLLATVTLLPVCAATPASCEPPLPAAIQQLVDRESGWSIVSLDLLPADDRALWQTSHKKECPGASVGHFISRSSLSYAVALIAKGPGAGYSEKLLVFTPRDEDFARIEVVGPKPVASPWVLWKAGPGISVGAQRAERVNVRLDSLIIEKMESIAYQYYWDQRRFRSLLTAH